MVEQTGKRKILDVIVSVALIAACAAVVTQTAWSFLHRVPQRVQRASAVGHTIQTKDIAWSNQRETVVLALSTTCHFCNDSYPFYQKLLDAAGKKQVPVFASFPQPDDEVKAHLSEKHVAGIALTHGGLSGVDISGTPTLLVVDSSGVVRKEWVGRLTPAQEEEVIQQL